MIELLKDLLLAVKVVVLLCVVCAVLFGMVHIGFMPANIEASVWNFVIMFVSMIAAVFIKLRLDRVLRKGHSK